MERKTYPEIETVDIQVIIHNILFCFRNLKTYFANGDLYNSKNYNTIEFDNAFSSIYFCLEYLASEKI